MIPLRLTVKNFMCYRGDVPTLDLEGIHVACLCGENGHGKTALLDAISWALWGEARTRTQEELVHQGQQHMEVELEFAARGQRYRVVRKHSRSVRSRQGSTILELQLATDNGFRPLTGNTLRETEARIEDILHMDYRTFVNTAFLRQGDADRFTTSKPTERKQTLAEVLDLSYYQGLEERAKLKSRKVQDDIRHLEGALSDRRQEIGRKSEYEAQLCSVEDALARIIPEAEARRLEVEDLRGAVDSLRGRRKELEALGRRTTDIQTEITQLERQARNHEAKIEGYESALRREKQIRESFHTLTSHRVELDRLDRALIGKAGLDRDKARLEEQVAAQKGRLSERAAQLGRRIKEDLLPKVKRLTETEEALRGLSREREMLDQLEEAAAQRREEALAIGAELHELQLANERLRREMEEDRKKFDMLEQGDKVCSLCKQSLGVEGQEHLRREYEERGLESKRQYRANTAGKDALSRTYKETNEQAAKTETDLQQGRQRTQARAAGLERDLEDSQRAKRELEPATAELQGVENDLETECFSRDERQRLALLDAEISSLNYDAGSHNENREQVKRLEGYDGLYRKLQEAVEGLPTEKEGRETTRQLLRRRQREIEDFRERESSLGEELKGLSALESRLDRGRTKLQLLESQQQSRLVDKRVLEQDIEKCIALETEIKEREKRRGQLVDGKAVYDELGIAFGKNGIQALIIEAAIPQLESDANELLGRLTDNRMFLKLQLQEGRRDSRSGLPSEELDIKVADEVGTRSYETFSGGEAFRIDFALRIALSKLLARRSGAPLPILFIDEGFGSQDRAGQERLTEAIQSIQDDFQKIIVITHIEQIRDAFPVRIEVTKTGSGSMFSVV